MLSTHKRNLTQGLTELSLPPPRGIQKISFHVSFVPLLHFGGSRVIKDKERKCFNVYNYLYKYKIINAYQLIYKNKF